jgi:hypothetical protein
LKWTYWTAAAMKSQSGKSSRSSRRTAKRPSTTGRASFPIAIASPENIRVIQTWRFSRTAASGVVLPDERTPYMRSNSASLPLPSRRPP